MSTDAIQAAFAKHHQAVTTEASWWQTIVYAVEASRQGDNMPLQHICTLLAELSQIQAGLAVPEQPLPAYADSARLPWGPPPLLPEGLPSTSALMDEGVAEPISADAPAVVSKRCGRPPKVKDAE